MSLKDSNYYSGETNADTFSAHRKLERVRQAMSLEARDPMGSDPVAKAFFTAVQWQPRGDKFDNSLLFALTQRHNMGKLTKSHSFADQIFKAFHRICLELDDSYPDDTKFDNPLTWVAIIDEVLEEPLLEDQFTADLLMDVLSNVADRAVGLEILLHSEHERLYSDQKVPRVLEVGSGGMQLLKLMSPEVKVPFQHIDVVRALGRQSRIQASQDRVLNHETEVINDILQQKQLFFGVGLDRLPRDEAVDKRVFAQTFRVPELRQEPAKIERFKALHTAQPTNLVRYVGDFSPEGVAYLGDQTGIDRFDLIALPTVLYLQDDATIKMMRNLARDLLSANGLIVYLDKIRPNPADRSALTFFKRFDHYNLLLEDPSAGKSLFDVIRHESGRCKEMKFGRDASVLALYRQLKRTKKPVFIS